MTTHRILFVDDETHILQGIQRMLRPMRAEWDMAFAASGAEALDALAQGTFDAVVSDMRMPGMSGTQLLLQVWARQSRAVRIILSGQSDGDGTRQATAVAHQFLSKPCEAAALKDAVLGACAARAHLPEHLQDTVTKAGALPVSLPVWEQMQAMLADVNTPAAQIAQIVSRTPSISAKVLQLVNSAFFGTPRPVSDPAEAVSLLGPDTLLALMPELFVPLPDAPPAADLRDVGRLLLAAYAPDRYAPLQAMPDSTALCLAEYAEFGADHAAVGASLLGLWGLPAALRQSVASHHFNCDCSASKENLHA